MNIVITKPQLKLIQESYDYNDLPLKTSTINHHKANKVEYGRQDSYQKYKKYKPKSENENKINKVRSKLIGIYDIFLCYNLTATHPPFSHYSLN